jgi:hypothetical protein
MEEIQMGHYLTYVLVPEATTDISQQYEEVQESHTAMEKAIEEQKSGVAVDTSGLMLEKFLQSYFTLVKTQEEGLVGVKGIPIESKVALLLEPYGLFHKVGEYRRECDCVFDNALKQMDGSPHRNSSIPICEFSKDKFSEKGFELAWRRKLLELGTPDPDCEECQGSGILVCHDNPAPKWDSWEIGTGFAENILKDCVKGNPDNLSIVPLRDLDLEKLPSPNHIVTPDGSWLSDQQWIWHSSALVKDERWEETVKAVMKDHADATLVVVNVHY